MIKRIVCLLLALCIMCPLCGAYASENDTEMTVDYGVLSIFGIDDTYFSETDSLTRKMTAAVVHKLAGEQYNNRNIKYFKDIEDTDDYLAAVNFVYERKFMSGDGDEFRPNDDITLAELYAVLVRALGYGAYADVVLDYPMGYLNVARKLGIDVGNNSNLNKAVTKIEAVEIFKEFMLAPVARMGMYEISNLINIETSAVTFAEAYCKIKPVYSEITSTYDGAVRHNELSAMGEITLKYDGGTLVAKDETESALEFLGHYTIAYVKNIDTQPVVVYIEDWKEVEEISIFAEDVVNIDSALTLMTYYSNGRERKLTIADDATIIFNGRQCFEVAPLDFYCISGKVKLVDVNSDNIFDIVYLDNYQSLIVESISSERNKIFGRNDEIITGLEDDKEINIEVVKNGEEVEIADIKAGDVLSYLESRDGKKFHIEVLESAVKGSVTKITKDTMSIDGIEYHLMIDDVSGYLSKKVTVGINQFGCISVVVEETNSDVNYAYLLNYAEDTLFETKVRLQLLETDDSVKVYQMAKKFYLNDVKSTPTDLVNHITSSGNIVRQLVKYRLDKDNNINRIYTAQPSGTSNKNALVKDEEYLAEKQIYLWQTFAGEYFIKPYVTKILTVFKDADGNIMEDAVTWKVTPLDSRGYNATMYDAKDCIAGVAMFEANWADYGNYFYTVYSDRDYNAFLVDEIEHTLDAEGAERIRINGWYNGERSSFIESDYVSFSEICGGDILEITNRRADIVYGYNKIYTLEQKLGDSANTFAGDKTYTSLGITTLGDRTEVKFKIHGKVINITDELEGLEGKNKMVMFDPKGSTSENDWMVFKLPLRAYTSPMNVYVYSRSAGKSRRLTADELCGDREAVGVVSYRSLLYLVLYED